MRPAAPPPILREMLREGARRAAATGRPVLVSMTEPTPQLDPLDAFTAFPGMPRAFWEHLEAESDRSRTLAGIGTAYTIRTSSTHRFAEAGRAWQASLDGALIAGPETGWGSGPLLLGGFSFDPLHPPTADWSGFPVTALTLPRLLLASSPTGSTLTLNGVLEPHTNPDHEAESLLQLRALALARATHPDPAIAAAPPCAEESPALQDALPAGCWHQKVAASAAEIRAGRYAKVVLARRAGLQISGSCGTRAARALRYLRATFPGAFLFAFAVPNDGADERLFLGATPERLVRLQGETVETAVLAGSSRRGRTAEEDRLLGRTLLGSAKDRHEHAVVATMLRWSLAPFCRTLDAPATPVLWQLQNVQHLYTPVRGQLNGPHSILEVIARLHPTPAVGGFPRQAALQTIRAREELDRGWYAAPVGWLDRAGQGEFAVALRSALLVPAPLGCMAHLYAGCGIMGDSDPGREYEESTLKMQAMLAALTQGGT
jgi:isochorismate synthase